MPGCAQNFHMPRDPSRSSNLLLRALQVQSPAIYAELASLLHPVRIANGTALTDAGVVPQSVYFIDEGVVSLVGQTASGKSLELACLGNEAVTHVGWLLGDAPPPYAFVAQMSVRAHRLRAADAVRLLRRSEARSGLVDRFCQFVIALLAQSALCARFHTSVQRLARRILLTSERAGTSVLELTHEDVALMVGAPRSLVTEALTVLRRSGCVESTRARITVVDAKALKRHACECYRTDHRRLASLERAIAARGGALHHS